MEIAIGEHVTFGTRSEPEPLKQYCVNASVYSLDHVTHGCPSDFTSPFWKQSLKSTLQLAKLKDLVPLHERSKCDISNQELELIKYLPMLFTPEAWTRC